MQATYVYTNDMVLDVKEQPVCHATGRDLHHIFMHLLLQAPDGVVYITDNSM